MTIPALVSAALGAPDTIGVRPDGQPSGLLLAPGEGRHLAARRQARTAARPAVQARSEDIEPLGHLTVSSQQHRGVSPTSLFPPLGLEAGAIGPTFRGHCRSARVPVR